MKNSTKRKKEQKREAPWVDRFLHTMSLYLGEASQDPMFCGCVFDAIRTPDGKLAGVRVVMCDDINGTPTRRLGSGDVEEKPALKLVHASKAASFLN